MNILWIPHTPAREGIHRRDQYFISHLKARHQITEITYEIPGFGSLCSVLRNGLTFYKEQGTELTRYHIRRLPNIPRLGGFDVSKVFGVDRSALNEWFFKRDIHRIIRNEDISIVIIAPSWYLTGFPPEDLPVPMVVDYLDTGPWEEDQVHPEKRYLQLADAALCVSSVAQERATALGVPNILLTNGVDIARMKSAKGADVRKALGIENNKVVSLIGLTTSPRLYFIEAVLEAKKTIADLKCLLVGKSEEVSERLAKIPNVDETFIQVGAVPYDEIAEYFAASDVGMYPADETTYFHGASPIKIFEYTAAGKPVVVPRLQEVQRVGLPNMVYAEPTVEKYALGILEAFKREPVEVDLSDYDWETLSEQLERFLLSVAQR